MAWEASTAAVHDRDEATLAEVEALGGQLAERTTGRDKEEAERLVVYSAACRSDIEAGVPHDSPMARMFQRPKRR